MDQFQELVVVNVTYWTKGSSATLSELDSGHALDTAWEDCVGDYDPKDWEEASNTEYVLQDTFMSASFYFLTDGVGPGFLEYEFMNEGTECFDREGIEKLAEAAKQQYQQIPVKQLQSWATPDGTVEYNFVTLWQMDLVHAASHGNYWGDNDDSDEWSRTFVRVVPMTEILKALVAEGKET